MRKILHLHGIGSAGGGATASVLKKLFSDIEVISPDIPVRPLEAFAFISKLVAGNEFDFVVGTSLGGFYAMLIKGIPKFLINPAMNAPTDIENPPLNLMFTFILLLLYLIFFSMYIG